MEAKLASVTVVVTDQAKAFEFYTKSVGWEKRTDLTGPNGYRWLTVAPKGESVEISLYPAGTSGNPNDPQGRLVPGGGAAMVLNVSDCAALFRELKGRGVRFREAEPMVQPWGTQATFSDPDGNLFTLLEPARPPGRP